MRPDGKQQDLFVEAPVWHEGLTGRRRLFVEYYCTSRECFLNATAAYIKAFGNNKQLSDSSVQSNSSRLMSDPKIREAVAKLLRARQNDEDRISEFQVLEILKTLSLYNPADIVDEYGNLKGKLEELGPLALCVTGIKRGSKGKEIKLFDRTKSLALLCDYLGIARTAEGSTVVNPVVYLSDKDTESLRGDEAAEATSAEDAQYEVVEA